LLELLMLLGILTISHDIYRTCMHASYPAIIQTKKFTTYALRVDTLENEFFYAVKHTPLSFDKLRICACDR
ncbi:hypothetical protein B9Z19DRAFT_1080397, partial [Tuber borchii]